jgi:hypoxanthine phosphoribosyltransferase
VKPYRVLFTEEQIHKRVEEIATDIGRDFNNRQLAVVGLLEDSFVFMADLIRKIDTEMVCYFMKADVAEDDGHVSRIKKIVYSPELDIQGKDVLLIGGVLETGITLDFLIKHLLLGRPNLLKICYLIDKPKCRKISLNADYAGFVSDFLEPHYLVGYGLGHENKHRNLPFVGVLNQS